VATERRLPCGSEATSINDFTVLVENAVLAPGVTKVDANRHLYHGLSEWDFRDEVLRRLLHGIQSLPSRKT
jgi:hypothetical protein